MVKITRNAHFVRNIKCVEMKYNFPLTFHLANKTKEKKKTTVVTLANKYGQGGKQ